MRSGIIGGIYFEMRRGIYRFCVLLTSSNNKLGTHGVGGESKVAIA